MSYLVLARKWRPKGFDDLVGQEPIMRILKNAISQGKIAHAYIFSGPRGVGKTSTARILAKAMNCKEGPTPSPCGVCEACVGITAGSSVDVTEIDGASNNSVDDIRDLRERVKYAPSGGKYKVYIIDEVHMLSGSAFNALLKTLEEPPSHVIFVLATTETKKIPATVLSRCQHMPFRRITTSEIKARMKQISDAEGIGISASALGLIAKAADGSMRDSLTLLDQISSFSSEINDDDVKTLLGIADAGLLFRVSKALITGNRVEILETIRLLAEQGSDMRSFAKELVQFFRDLLVASVMKRPEEVLDLTAEELPAIKEIISATTEDQLTLMLGEILKADGDVRNSSSPRLALEMSLIRASFLSAMKPIRDIIENIDKLELLLGAAPQSLPGPRTVEPIEPFKPIEPVEPVEEAEETIDVPVVQAISEEKDIAYVWHKTLEKIDAPLASKLSQAEPELQGDELLLKLNGGAAVFADSIHANNKAIARVVSDELGRTVTIKIVTTQKKGPRQKGLKEKAMETPLIKEALELFDGRVVDVIPLKNSKNGGDDV